MLGQVLTHLRVHAGIAGLPSVKAVHITVLHAEGRSDKYSIVNLQVRRAFRPRSLYVFGSYELAIALHVTRNREQRFQLRSDRCVFEIGFHALHHIVSG
jgi:hypothetical protein